MSYHTKVAQAPFESDDHHTLAVNPAIPSNAFACRGRCNADDDDDDEENDSNWGQQVQQMRRPPPAPSAFSRGLKSLSSSVDGVISEVMLLPPSFVQARRGLEGSPQPRVFTASASAAGYGENPQSQGQVASDLSPLHTASEAPVLPPPMVSMLSVAHMMAASTSSAAMTSDTAQRLRAWLVQDRLRTHSTSLM